MLKTLASLPRRRDGATATEFALAAPLLLLLAAGIIEIGSFLFALTLLEAGVREASRFGITGREVAVGTSRETTIRNIVVANGIGLIDAARLQVQVTVYPGFSQIGQPEPFIDQAPFNGIHDPGETFTDVNGNGVWDADMGVAGTGGAGDVVVYTLTYPWRLLTGFLGPLLGEQLTLRASIAVRNEPYPEP